MSRMSLAKMERVVPGRITPDDPIVLQHPRSPWPIVVPYGQPLYPPRSKGREHRLGEQGTEQAVRLEGARRSREETPEGLYPEAPWRGRQRVERETKESAASGDVVRKKHGKEKREEERGLIRALNLEENHPVEDPGQDLHPDPLQ